MSTRAKVITRLAMTCILLAGLGQAIAQTPGAANDDQLTANVRKALDNKRFRDVQVAVSNGVVTLTGTVDVYSAKEDANRRVRHEKNLRAVQDLIQVAGPEIDDTTLRNKLAEKLAYDRVGYGTTTFNAFTIGVQKGVVTLGGSAYSPTDKDSAVSLVENYPGVKDVIDNIDVLPLSPMDDRIRLAEARAIYTAPQLNKYAVDPARPIRITVQNGNVTLSGVVDTQSDKDIANIRANGVSGVFKVTNDIQVAGESESK